MSELTDDQREVIELRFFAGLSVLEAPSRWVARRDHPRPQFRAIASLRRSIGIEHQGDRRTAEILGAGATVSYDDMDRAAQDQLEDLLDAYADARLAPTGPVLARMRIAVLAEAATAAAERRRQEDLPVRRRRFSLPVLHVPRRAFALGMAASLTLAPRASSLHPPQRVLQRAPRDRYRAAAAKPDEQLRRARTTSKTASASRGRGSHRRHRCPRAALVASVHLDAPSPPATNAGRLAHLQSASRSTWRAPGLAGRLPTELPQHLSSTPSTHQRPSTSSRQGDE